MTWPQPPASTETLATPAPCREYWFALPATPASARAARTTVRDRLGVWQMPEDTSDDAILLVSELATNAVLHTDSERLLCYLTLTVDGQCLRIEVHDGGRAPLRPPAPQPDPDQEGGRGLILVRELAERWGTARSTRAEGNVVWAELTPTPNHRRPAPYAAPNSTAPQQGVLLLPRPTQRRQP
ncbi:ATP-binding protein [Streptomyces sp. NPDC016845]|uniref:ATP-binding protein n=1 Tax=Streptomyces sp. NPDC016845 TaxID=3364972 RepID=UPI0037BE0280